MPLFTKESLETLKQRVDIVDVIESYVELKRSGVSYKGLCPFHDEKSPSFHVTKGQGFFHCFGCGAHGDVISFLMQHAKLSFSDAVEMLAQRYQVTLEVVESASERDKFDKAAHKQALERACQLYHHFLLHTSQGHAACKYLYNRGIDLAFIQRFRLGYALPERDLFCKAMARVGVQEKTLIEAGILSESAKGLRDPFSDRIMFPICDASGSVIGFSGRKFKEETFGGKYVNTSETPLFKKSKVLFGLDQSRRRMAKERQAIIVEGQIDALRLLFHGLDLVVASQGTAFGESHLKELTGLGVREVFLAFDSDKAGREAAFKVGHLFAKAGVGVKVMQMPQGADPDSYVQSKGIDAFLELLKGSGDYLAFLVEHLSMQFDLSSPAGKNGLVHESVRQIRQWEEPVLVHESLRRLAQILQLPEEAVGSVGIAPTHVFTKKSAFAGTLEIDPDRVLESDLLRWLVITGPLKPHFAILAIKNLKPSHFCVPVCRRAFETIQEAAEIGQTCDFLTLAAHLGDSEVQELIHDLHFRKVNLERSEGLFRTVVQKLLEREWMSKREELRLKIQSGSCSDEEVTALLQEFDRLKKTPPKVVE